MRKSYIYSFLSMTCLALILFGCGDGIPLASPDREKPREVQPEKEKQVIPPPDHSPSPAAEKTLPGETNSLPDIGFPDAPYPAENFGKLLFDDEFAPPNPLWQSSGDFQTAREENLTLLKIHSSNGEIARVELPFEHPRNIVYKMRYRINQGFVDVVLALNHDRGARFVINTSRKEKNINYRFFFQPGHEGKQYELGGGQLVGDGEWIALDFRQYDRYMDFFLGQEHIFSWKLPDEYIQERGEVAFDVYDPYGGEAEMQLDRFSIYESTPENVFLDTLPVGNVLDQTRQVSFQELNFDTISKPIPERYETAEGWNVSYFIPPGDVRNPNDLEITAQGTIVTLQQRNWGLVAVGEDSSPEWYLDTKTTLGEVVTNGILDRDRAGNLYLIHNGQVYFVDKPGNVRPLFDLQGHSASLAQSPGDGKLYFIENRNIKSWADGNKEIIKENFVGEGQLVFTADGTPFYYPWGGTVVYELIPGSFEIKQVIFHGDYALPEIEPTYFNRLAVQGENLVMTYNSEVLRIHPASGEVERLVTGFNQLEGISTGPEKVCFTSRFDSGVYCWKDGRVSVVVTPNFLMTPMGLAVNSRGEVYSGNDESTQLFKYSSEGRYLMSFPVNVCQSPWVDMTLDDRDNLYVSAGEYFTDSSSLVQITAEDKVTVLLDYPEIRYPSGIDWHGGMIYVVEAETGSLLEIDADLNKSAVLSDIVLPGFQGSIPMRVDRDGNFYIYQTQKNQQQVYHVSREGQWKPLMLPVDQKSITALEYWPEKDALLIGTTDFWEGGSRLLMVDIQKGSAITLFSGSYSVSGIAVTPEGDILISDDWDNCIIRLTRQ